MHLIYNASRYVNCHCLTSTVGQANCATRNFSGWTGSDFFYHEKHDNTRTFHVTMQNGARESDVLLS